LVSEIGGLKIDHILHEFIVFTPPLSD
jgi:hypothetical protein